MLHWVSLGSLLALISISSAATTTWPANDFSSTAQHPVHSEQHSDPSVNNKKTRITIANMTCAFFEQPLDHFHVPAEQSPTYQQRYCVYDKYVKKGSSQPAPIFFYTGNESPLEQYINNTGLMWELAPDFHAEIIFVEHRYEGKSLPSPSNPNCLAYSSSKQALEDYARFLEYWMLQNATVDSNGVLQRRPVIAFGGSYGGMLAAWFRMKYPHLVTGAIAASAPIWALPRTNSERIDGAYQIIHRGMSLPYPPTDIKEKQLQKEISNESVNHCPNNMLASWPLLKYLASIKNSTAATPARTRATQHLEKHNQNDHETYPGLSKLTKWFKLCEPLKDPSEVETLMEWIKTPWFDMAEGSFPYASSYIPFSLIKSNGTILKLPPWPLQAACWNESKLHQDWGIRFDGDTSQVIYDVTYGDDSGLTLSIDWDDMVPLNNDTLSWDQILNSSSIEGLLTSVRDSVAVWYNITKEEPCFNLTPAINLETAERTQRGMRRTPHNKAQEQGNLDKQYLEKTAGDPLTAAKERGLRAVETSPITTRLADLFRAPHLNPKKDDNKNATAECESYIAGGSWNSLCCNENMNLIIYEAQGMGRDMLWPPSYPKGTANHADVIQHNDQLANETVPGFCLDPDKIFGYSQLPVDPWATRLDTYYGGTRIDSHSNIVFSNGLLDPWTAGGVQVPWEFISTKSYEGPTVLPIGPESHDMIVLLIEFGGHHTDLMYSDEKDPDCVTQARQVEKEYIAKWVEQQAYSRVAS